MLLLVANHRKSEVATMRNACQTMCLHPSAHLATREVNLFAVRPLPDPLRDVDAVAVGLVHAQNFGLGSPTFDEARTGRAIWGGVLRAGGELQDL